MNGNLAFGLIGEGYFLLIVWSVFAVCIILVVRTHIRVRKAERRLYDFLKSNRDPSADKQ